MKVVGWNSEYDTSGSGGKITGGFAWVWHKELPQLDNDISSTDNNEIKEGKSLVGSQISGDEL